MSCFSWLSRMPEWKFLYETQEQLKIVFRFLAESPLEASIYLSPAAPREFFDAWEGISRARTSLQLPLTGPEKEAMQAAVQNYEAIALREKIFPFVKCTFSYIYHFRPQVEMEYPHLPYISPYEFATQPLLGLEGFLGAENWCYRSLIFDSVNDPSQIRDIKEFIARDVPGRYTINNFFLKLNARYSTYDHYYTRGSNDGVLYTQVGRGGEKTIILEYKTDPRQREQQEGQQQLFPDLPKLLTEGGLRILNDL